MTQPDDALAKKRFFAITAMRLMGALLVLAGFVLIRGGVELAGQPTDRWIGVAVVLVGAFDFAVMPLLLARRWRSPRDL
jgi:drug/metabolite transporter (DMT)-like permease